MENITELVHRRRSVRTFDGKEVTENDREKLALFMEKIENPYGIPVSFIGSCNGNLKEILILIEEWTVEQIGGRYEIQT